MSLFNHLLGGNPLVKCIVLGLLPFSAGLPTNMRRDTISSNDDGSSGIPSSRIATNEPTRLDPQLGGAHRAEDHSLSAESKSALAVGTALGLLFVILSTFAVLSVKRGWHHKLPARFRANKQKPYCTSAEKYPVYFNKYNPSREHLFSRGSSTVSRASIHSEHALYQNPPTFTRANSLYQPVEVYQAQLLKVPHQGIHTPPTAVSIRSVHCKRTSKSDREAQVRPSSSSSESTVRAPSPSPSHKEQDTKQFPIPPPITIPPPIKLQPLKGPWSDE
ncbi:hypothetical protein AJ79_04256 [Helicocarpus griseus UAMH5409]|uniref:Uncharacterized protein n=1 Tax=Helicocarpus griseus UAMH5409 TaxID=1447875 RepID=A0A2B7XV59_9EURO|nr:hypothetical protein AJ79_04256 [Helicocarpus griseus UAMH5409]